MSDCVAWTRGRAFPRLALAGLGLLLLSGCSSDVTRFTQSESPFSNPFASNTAAPTPGVTASPLAQGAPAASATRTASLSKPQAVGGSAVGWTAVGGSPIVVANGETLDTLSGRYGVPAAALLSANGLSSASEVKSGMRLVVPVYHADGHAVASTEKEKSARNAMRTSPTPNRPSPPRARRRTRRKRRPPKPTNSARRRRSPSQRTARAPRSRRRSRPSRRRAKSRRSIRRRRATSNRARRKQRSR